MDRWLDFLTRQGATWQNGRLNGFPGEETISPARLVPLLDHRLITVQGPDAAKFLQGQLTCDMRRVEQNQVLLGAHCNPKGRMISSFVIAMTGPDRFTLRLRRDIAEQAKAALQKYIVFAKAKITDDDAVALALLGDTSNLSLPLDLPPSGASSAAPGTTVIAHSPQFVELWLEAEQAEKLWLQLGTSFTPSGTAWFDLHQVRAGIAEVQAATVEEFIPQMFNYQAVDAVSFKKGCYTGQEIVARMQYRGQLKKRAYRAALTEQIAIPVGTDIVTPANSGSGVGTVVASALAGNANEVLVVTSADVATGQAMALQSASKLEWLPLPYAIP